MTDTEAHTSSEWDTLVEIGAYPTLSLAHEHSLVILAMGRPCWVAEGARGGYTLHAEPEAAPAIARELLAYENERETPKPTAPAREMFHHPAGWGAYAIWMISLILAYIWQHQNPALAERAASSSTGFIGNHEWWRPFTALFLHADPPHLIGNLLSGLLFGTLVARSIGPLRGWLLILACGTAGNALTSAITWPDSFVSIGASTAVFAALGILSGLGFSAMLRDRLQVPWAKTVGPILAGIILLGWLGGGTPGGNTDVLGHVFGFGSGLTAGIIVGTLTPPAADSSLENPRLVSK